MIVAHVANNLVWGVGSVVKALCKYHADFKPMVLVRHKSFKDGQIRQLKVPFYVGKNGPALTRLLAKADVINLHAFDDDWSFYEAIRPLKKPVAITLHFGIVCPRVSAQLICISPKVRAIQKPGNRCIVIPNGVDLEHFAPAARKHTLRKVILARMCRPNKCDEFFWPAMIEVLNVRAHTQLWLIGDSGRSTKKIKRLGIVDDIPAILSKIDILVHTPIDAKPSTLDLVEMEGMAMGIPVLISSHKGVGPAVGRGCRDLLIPPGDCARLKEKLLRLVDDSVLRREMGERALRVARERFDCRLMAQRYEDTYRSILR